MLITRVSMLTGKRRTREIPVTDEQVTRFMNGDELIQNIFPQLSAGDREFIMTGITEDEWDSIFPPEEPEDEAAF